jgi:hypothetical protein
MKLEITGQVGPTILGDGVSTQPFRQGRTGEHIISMLHGRLYEQCFRNALYSAGSGATALSANTITLTATTTPIVGVYNPITSPVNLVILKAMAQVYINTLTTPVGCGPLVWASSVGNLAVSTGAAPLNLKTLVAAGAYAKAFNGGVALTGLTNSLVVFGSAGFPGMPVITHGTITAVTTQAAIGGFEDFEGSLIIPPGGVLALLNTTSTTTVSAAARLFWEEVGV